MTKNLTPKVMQGPAEYCGSIYQLDDGRLLIVGKEVDPYDTGSDELLLDAVNMLLDEQDVGENENALIIDRALLAGVVPGWKTIDSAPRDGTEIDLYGGFFAPKPMPGYWDRVEGDEQTWEGFAERVSGHIPDDQPTHWLPRPVPPAEKVEA